MNQHRGVSPGLRITSAEHPFAPEFSLPDLTGKTLKLSDYRGKVVLLDFWATWCDPCREEIPHFVELQNKLGDQGFEIIGVSMDDGPEPVRDFYQQFNAANPFADGTPMRYRRQVLEPGGSQSANDLVRRFLGRPQTTAALEKWIGIEFAPAR